ncbi:Golgi-specific brefeldin A-resistance guanine nucleotide exchange factor 1 [Eumeta japonica]|uniref:Golgi-specific brefeldin A-resistance guanine nucleotide exchange factor 1 n=1 Tax=Eumeta variegata TaxID=151549 RepID=A0A4C1X294_EUMVA|nr:Golgi-specific brefeldin A-resistance guanine nucleotide exchange factor 1 [Eumeta japonica]
MSLPGNGIFVVQGEMAMLVTAMRRSTRWGSHTFPNEEYDVLMRTFQDLKTILNQVDDLRLLDPATYLSPFLEVIRSKETTGPVTSLALSAIHKFLSYGLIDPTHPSVPATVEDIADAVTHARFVGTDHSSDGVVLMKILQVLRTLMLSPEGVMLTDESVCEIMLSCFRICFETRLTELLRRNAEQCLRDMTQLIFMRLPQFPLEDPATGTNFNSTIGLSLKKKDKSNRKKTANAMEKSSSFVEQSNSTSQIDHDDDSSKYSNNRKQSEDKNLLNEAEITIEPIEQPLMSPTKKHGRHSSMDLASINTPITQLLEKCVNDAENATPKDASHENVEEPVIVTEEVGTESEKLLEKSEEAYEKTQDLMEIDGQKSTKVLVSEETGERLEEYVNHRGIRFTPQDETTNLQPYGLVCVRELFRFLISLCNPLDTQNTPAMVHLGLCLVETALEVGVDQIAKYPSLLYLVKDPLCKNLLSLLSTERISIFALDLQILFLLFEALRTHLKFQMEAFFKKIIEIISADTTKAIYELKEIHHLALESLAQMFRIPGLCAELYLNYDCDTYCANIFEDLAKLLSKNVVSSTAYNIHALSLEALMTIIEAIENASTQGKMTSIKVADAIEKVEDHELDEVKYGKSGHVSLELGGLDDVSVVSDHVTHDISQYYSGGRISRHRANSDTPSEAELDNVKNMKKWIATGTELFNQKPERGIDYLQEHGVLSTPLDPHQVSMFLRENPDLDKKMIGEYLCKRSSLNEEEGPSVLAAFVNSFDFSSLRIDQALRLYLETFRLPGEAPLIFLVLERFAERWHTSNGEPFANTDAAFRLAYAVIMLNVDQHNHNAKKLNVPMNVDDFVKNLRGCNGSGDFDQAMLETIFYSIKNEEMVMPAERTGAVRDAYLWRVLQRRGAGPGARYFCAPHAAGQHARLFAVACPPAVTALSAAFERAAAPTEEELEDTRDCPAPRALAGLERCAALIARQPDSPGDQITLDTLVLTLCKFTGLLTLADNANYITIGVTLGQSTKAQLALRRTCAVVARHADAVRDAWRHVLEIVRTLYIGRLLPKSLVEAEDYLSTTGTVSLIRDTSRASEAGLLSSIYSYIALGDAGVRTPTPHEKTLMDVGTECVAKCHLPGLLVTETKFLQLESLQELVRAMINAGTPPESDSMQLNPQLEDIAIFFLELLSQTLIQNRDRALHVWPEAGAHFRRTVLWAAAGSNRDVAACRTLTALLRTVARLMRSEHCAPTALAQLTMLFELPYRLFYRHAKLISCGLYELVKTSAQNVHSADDWRVVFSLLCAAGAGAWPRDAQVAVSTAASSSRSSCSEDESEFRPVSLSSESELSHSPHMQGWILVKNEASADKEPELDDVWLRSHRTSALARCCEALALVVRDVAHVTPYNCRAAVRAVRVFVRATLHAVEKKLNLENAQRDKRKTSRPSSARRGRHEDSSGEEDNTLDHYHMVSMQLLDLMHTLHSRTAQIFRWWREESDQRQEEYDLWDVAWMPLLQGIALFCTDSRKQRKPYEMLGQMAPKRCARERDERAICEVANSAVAYLQRALLAPGLQAMGGSGWEACFHSVLFPLLERLPRRADVTARANTIMCKVFLHHLSALGSRPTFAALWLRVVRVQAALVTGAPADEPLTEAALESLKNMILVMDSVKIFSNGDGYNELWYLTWEKIAEFLPNLKDELFPQAKDPTAKTQPPSHIQAAIPQTLPTLVPVSPVLYQPTVVTPTQPQGIPITPPIGIPNSSPNIMLSNIGAPASSPIITPAPILVTPNLVTPVSNYTTFPPLSVTSVPSTLVTATQSLITSSSSLQGVQNKTSAPTAGSVPIRNPLYAQMGLASSVLLQPLNQMVSTPIGITLPSQVSIVCPTDDSKRVSDVKPAELAPLNQELKTSILLEENASTVRDELYTEYLVDPYNDRIMSTEEATLYDPQNHRGSLKDPESLELIPDPFVTEKQKSLSTDSTPMHAKHKTHFGSIDNLKAEDSSIFNFSNYFGSVSETIPPGSEILFGDNMHPPPEG